MQNIVYLNQCTSFNLKLAILSLYNLDANMMVFTLCICLHSIYYLWRRGSKQQNALSRFVENISGPSILEWSLWWYSLIWGPSGWSESQKSISPVNQNKKLILSYVIRLDILCVLHLCCGHSKPLEGFRC